MKRELEFRVYDYDAKKMRYLKNEHDFICFNSDGSAYYHNMQTGLGEWFSDLMQYTGLKDNNGVKIFEGDVIEEGCNGLISSVIWDNEIGTYKLKNLGDYYIKDAPIEWEVIGNIYEDNKGSESDVKDK